MDITIDVEDYKLNVRTAGIIIDKYPLRPEVIKEILKNGKFPVHKINLG